MVTVGGGTPSVRTGYGHSGRGYTICTDWVPSQWAGVHHLYGLGTVIVGGGTPSVRTGYRHSGRGCTISTDWVRSQWAGDSRPFNHLYELGTVTVGGGFKAVRSTVRTGYGHRGKGFKAVRLRTGYDHSAGDARPFDQFACFQKT